MAVSHAVITSKDVVIKIELRCIIYLTFGLIKKCIQYIGQNICIQIHSKKVNDTL